ncbi:putative F-box associated interaction domain-containing protein [Medicago truncatula]|uniref:F-box protein interaction domain protein n=1 Tax=Medicago truncatula TaxID=3880 RepID=G7IXV1_MEDTR|nr:F-box protein interaction domain protein [Medicago truncatula]RHN66856.1 putative F-box associated interaction domain-containing protein [Medicago truncatula]
MPKSFFEIYSLQSDSWRKLDLDMPTRHLNTDSEVYFNGVCHWLGKSTDVTYVMSFDFSNEVFFSKPLPLEDVHNDFDVNLAVLCPLLQY